MHMAPQAEFSFKIAVWDDGIYRVGFNELGYSGNLLQALVFSCP